MRFRFEHVIDGPLGAAERALLHPSTLARLPRYAPLVGSAELLDRQEVGGRLERTVQFRAASLPAVLDRLAPAGAGRWVEQTHWDRSEHAGSFCIELTLSPALRRRFACDGTYRLEPIDPSRTRRVVEGHLGVDAPGLGPLLERALVALIERQFAGEARLLGDLARSS